MQDQDSTDCVKFQELFDRPVLAIFDAHAGSSDGGAVLLKAADARLGMTRMLAACIDDVRQSGKISHSMEDVIGQRVFGMACGYSDCNDAARLANDPVQKLLVGRDPLGGDALASQPTLSRFENSVTWKDLFRMGDGMMKCVVKRHHERLSPKVKLITLDLDPTDDPTHGAQQLSFFNGFYDEHCYLPVVGFMTFNEESEQYLFAAMLRPGNVAAKVGAIGILKRTIAELRKKFPEAQIRVRLDGGFAAPEIFDYLEGEDVEYVINMGKNAVLKCKAELQMTEVRKLSAASNRTEHVYDETQYKAGTWHKPRRVIIKAEVVCQVGREAKDNPRFVVTNMKQSPEHIYRNIYSARGDAENRIKELKNGVQIDRTSCTNFKANQMRVLFSAAAYILFQEIRLAATGTALAKAQVISLQLHLVKLGARVVSSVRRIILHLPASYPNLTAFRQIALTLSSSG